MATLYQQLPPLWIGLVLKQEHYLGIGGDEMNDWQLLEQQDCQALLSGPCGLPHLQGRGTGKVAEGAGGVSLDRGGNMGYMGNMGNMGGMGYMGNMGNMENMSNMGNMCNFGIVGNMGNVANFGIVGNMGNMGNVGQR